MGLDMYLEGHIYHNQVARKNKVKRTVIDLGYWRKHPDLHGAIVEYIAKGVDECQEIPIDEANLKMLIRLTDEEELPHTSGFFFGESQDEYRKETLAILRDALKWLQAECVDTESRTVVYRASW